MRNAREVCQRECPGVRGRIDPGALLIEHMIVKMGSVIVGPDTGSATAYASRRRALIDIAVLDVNLNGVKSFPIAAVLTDRGIPFDRLRIYMCRGRMPRHSGRHQALYGGQACRSLCKGKIGIVFFLINKQSARQITLLRLCPARRIVARFALNLRRFQNEHPAP